ncbi:MAG: hypothetical protein ACI8WB_003892, partial [Phenylobacterium sp.]
NEFVVLVEIQIIPAIFVHSKEPNIHRFKLPLSERLKAITPHSPEFWERSE